MRWALKDDPSQWSGESHIDKIEKLSDELDLSDLYYFFEQSTDLFCVATPTHLIRVNRAWIGRLGWSRGELTSVPWSEFLHPDDRARTLDLVDEVMKAEHVCDFTNRWRTRNGAYITICWSASPYNQGKTYAVGRVCPLRQEGCK